MYPVQEEILVVAVEGYYVLYVSVHMYSTEDICIYVCVHRFMYDSYVRLS